MRWAAMALICTVMAGCTSYSQPGLFGGVSARQTGKAVWDIRASGTAFTASQTIEDFAYLKAAEVGRIEGYYALTVLTGQSARVLEAGEPLPEENNPISVCDTVTCDPTSPYRTPSASTIAKPRSVLRVRYFTEAEYAGLSGEEQAYALRLDDLWAELAPQYLSGGS